MPCDYATGLFKELSFRQIKDGHNAMIILWYNICWFSEYSNGKDSYNCLFFLFKVKYTAKEIVHGVLRFLRPVSRTYHLVLNKLTSIFSHLHISINYWPIITRNGSVIVYNTLKGILHDSAKCKTKIFMCYHYRKHHISDCIKSILI